MTKREQIKYAIAVLVVGGHEIPKYDASHCDGYGAYHWTMERDNILLMRESDREAWAQKFITLRGRRELKSDSKAFIPRSMPISQVNAKFYRDTWDAHATEQGWCRCEECHRILLGFSPYFISHNLSRGAYPQLRTHPENVSILCKQHHDQWETGDRKAMRIYPEKLNIMHRLKLEVAKSIKGVTLP